jgi:cobalt-zinc-cadmium efflux system outer membrane protein
MCFHLPSRILIAAALLIASAWHGYGASLDSLVAEALASNPEVKFYRAGIAAAKGQLRTAGTLPNPELGAQAGVKTANPDGSVGAAVALTLAQPLEYPGRMALRKAIAAGDIELAELGFAQFREKLVARVRALASTIIAAQEQMHAVREIAARFRSLAEVLAQRGIAGPAPLLETRLIEVNAASVERQVAAAELEWKNAELQLNQLCGRSPTQQIQLPDGALRFSDPPADSLVAAARSYAFEGRLKRVELQKATRQVALAKHERYPTVSVGPYFSREEAADIEYQAGLSAVLPLPLWNRNRGNIETSIARGRQAEAALLMAQRDVERRVRENAQVLQAKRTQLARAAAGGLQQVREIAESADRDYRRGAVPLTSYIESQKQYLEATTAIFEVRKQALGAAEELETLTGRKLISLTNEKDADDR